ncbi:MAG: hypothetical protein KY476_24610 [Planctomycetes bacterium]|nr:hypothetical protein [Planctomycetota bacterium]
MASRIDDLAASDFGRAFEEAQEDVIRGIGGNRLLTKEVRAIVQLDSSGDRGGIRDSERGRHIDFAGQIEVAIDQEVRPDDEWVIRGRVYKTIGDTVGIDGGSKTYVIHHRRGLRGREPRR